MKKVIMNERRGINFERSPQRLSASSPHHVLSSSLGPVHGGRTPDSPSPESRSEDDQPKSNTHRALYFSSLLGHSFRILLGAIIGLLIWLYSIHYDFKVIPLAIGAAMGHVEITCLDLPGDSWKAVPRCVE